MAFSPRPDGCRGCPANTWGLGWVEPEGPPNAKLAFVGQGSGETEGFSGTPFHPKAPAGRMLTRWIYRSYLQRSEVLVGNLIQCWLPKVKTKAGAFGNRDPTLAEIKWCWNAHVGPWLHKLVRGEWLWGVVPVGVPAAKFLLGLAWDKGGERYAGTIQLVELPKIGTNEASV